MKSILIFLSLLLSFFSGLAQNTLINDYDTLEIVNWNLEYFGDKASELPQEMYDTKTIMDSLNADIYALVEIVNKDSLASLVQSMNGSYNYILSPFGSFASNVNDPDWAGDQKMAFVYRTSMVKNIAARPLLENSIGNAYYNWSSGRFPYLVSADVLGSDQVWRNIKFVIIHAKAYSDNSSCNRRYAGGLEMKDTLDAHFANDRIIILGDYNDDFDSTICSNSTTSNYSYLVADSNSSTANYYKSPTLPLSKMGIASINGYTSFIDHVMLSNEMVPYYVPGSAEMLKNKVNNWVTDYNTYVSDHFPVLTKYYLGATAIQNVATDDFIKIYPNPASDFIHIELHANQVHYAIFTTDNRKIMSGELNNKMNSISLSDLSNGMYYIKLSFENKMTITKPLMIMK